MSGRLGEQERLADMSYGQIEQLIRRLSSADLSPEHVRRLLRDDRLPEQWVRQLRQLIDPLDASIYNNMFARTIEIFDAFTLENERRGFPFDRQQIDGLEELRLSHHEYRSVLSRVLTLDIWLGNEHDTFQFLCDWMRRWGGVIGKEIEFRLTPEISSLKRYGKKPSVRWVLLDLAGSLLNRPRGHHNPARQAGFAVLSAAALHPSWAHQVGSSYAPDVRLDGLQSRRKGTRKWDSTPVLNRHLGSTQLDLVPSGRSIPSVASVPFLDVDSLM